MTAERRLERGTSRVFHFVLVTPFDHEDRPSPQRNTLPIHDRNASPGYDVQPLVPTAMTLSRPTPAAPGAITIFAACAFFVLRTTRNPFPNRSRFAFIRGALDVSTAEGALHAVDRSSSTPAGE
jgi:hypothetical protein